MGRLGLMLFVTVLVQGSPDAELRAFERTRFDAMIKADRWPTAPMAIW